VRRFRVKHERDPHAFGAKSDLVFRRTHSIDDELDWLDAEGPTSPALVAHLHRHAADYDYCLFFSYRYYHAFHGARTVPGRAILVPTAERDEAVGLSIFGAIFRGVRALMYNSPEERAMIQAVSGNHDVPGVVVGVGSDVPQNPQPARFRQKFGIRGPFAIYVGRIDQNKGCKELFDFFQAYAKDRSGRLTLVLIGNSLLPIPDHPRIRHLGFVDDTDKFDAMAAADVLMMPSYFESLSMVALEAWALGRRVLANAKCDVLKGQCIRSNAGLYYDTFPEFFEALHAIEHNKWLSGALGRNGRRFFRDHYDWSVIERKYLEMLDRLSHEQTTRRMEPLPGFVERRRRDVPAAESALAALAAGAAAEHLAAGDQSAGGRRRA
jgi:glycosyltransferase involved in cell wall biosynthesis